MEAARAAASRAGDLVGGCGDGESLGGFGGGINTEGGRGGGFGSDFFSGLKVFGRRRRNLARQRGQSTAVQSIDDALYCTGDPADDDSLLFVYLTCFVRKHPFSAPCLRLACLAFDQHISPVSAST